MNILRRFLGSRKHPRFHTQGTAFVLIGTDDKGKRKIQILDISEGGCAFVYNGSKKDIKEAGFLSLLSEATLCLEHVDFMTVSDTPLSRNDALNETFRRRGIKFKWLGVFDRKRLRDFIAQIALCRTD
jgi:c-di-GMP-binding flagellar brake protein YcgR